MGLYYREKIIGEVTIYRNGNRERGWEWEWDSEKRYNYRTNGWVQMSDIGVAPRDLPVSGPINHTHSMRDIGDIPDFRSLGESLRRIYVATSSTGVTETLSTTTYHSHHHHQHQQTQATLRPPRQPQSRYLTYPRVNSNHERLAATRLLHPSIYQPTNAQ